MTLDCEFILVVPRMNEKQVVVSVSAQYYFVNVGQGKDQKRVRVPYGVGKPERLLKAGNHHAPSNLFFTEANLLVSPTLLPGFGQTKPTCFKYLFHYQPSTQKTSRFRFTSPILMQSLFKCLLNLSLWISIAHVHSYLLQAVVWTQYLVFYTWNCSPLAEAAM